MCKSNRKYFLYINGQAVAVTKQVYDAYWHYTEKEKYFMEKLKMESFVCDQEARTALFFPSREDSYERLLGLEMDFSAEDPPVEDQALRSIQMAELLETLGVTEQRIILGLFFEQRTERELATELQLSQNTVHYWKEAALKKLKKFLENNL